MEISWDLEKNKFLMETRNICFEMILDKIIDGDFIGPEMNPARDNQYRIIVLLNGYPYVIPMIIDEKENWFFKTMYPSRKEKERCETHENQS